MHRHLTGFFCASAAFLAACAGTSSGAPSNAVSFTMTIVGSKMTPTARLTAAKGQTITLSFTTDRDEEIHLHGFERKFAAKAGKPESQTFTADRTGSFEIEIEDSSTHLGELDINPS